ncbi:FtsX-like permease family protein [Conexibacter arvalis]|uniref:Putative ABC transport system permease protein n=1 Tax=Conexibacter arvalis TaxID=912552 RepID=A0A840ILU1_9ACTN|nr:ABC transporter permease [Conexibacter arvalis]MBB4665113.1 putative ABC transport system permease protein [Conexibacter arvalis]
MSLRNLLWFWWRRFPHRAKHEELFALVGIAVGVALLFAAQVSNRSLGASVAKLTDGLVGDAQLQLKARDARGFAESMIPAIERLDGIRAVAPVLEAHANVVRDGRERSVTLLAADARLAHLGGSLVRGAAAVRLDRLDAVVLPADVGRTLTAAVGETVAIQTRGRKVDAPVAAILGANHLGPLSASPIVMTSLRFAQRATGLNGRVTRLYVLAEAGQSELARSHLERFARGRLDVLPVAHDERVFAQLSMPSDSSTSLFAGISALVGFLFAFNAMLMMARERRGLIAEMRMSGFRASAVVQVILFDALVLGAGASALGIAIGNLLSKGVFEPDPGYLAIAFPIGTARVIEPATVALALGAGMLAALAAALVPLAATYRSRGPMDAIDDDGLDPGRRMLAPRRRLLLTGLGCLLATTAILAFTPAAALAGMATLVAAMLLWLGPLLGFVVTALHRFQRRLASVVPTIASGELIAASTRSMAISAIAAIAVFGTTSIEGARVDLQRGLDPNARELTEVTDVWVSPRGDANLLATSPFPARLATERIRRSPAVMSVSVYRGAFLDIGDRRTWVIAPPRDATTPVPQSQIVEGNPADATARLREGGWAVASEAVAQQLGLTVGQRFRLDSPRPATLRLAAITTNFGWSPGVLVVNADDYRTAWGDGDASALQVRLSEGTLPAAGARAVERALGPGSPYAVQTASEREAGFRATTRAGLSRLQQVAALLVVAAALAIAAGTAATVWPRRARLADLKLVGIGAGSLWRAQLLESSILVITGAAVGAAFGLYGQQLLDRALNSVTGFPVVHTLGVTSALASLGIVTAVALLVVAIPGWWATRVPASAAFDD